MSSDIKEIVKTINKYSMDKTRERLSLLDLDTLQRLREYLDDIYYNSGEYAISDEKYDILRDILDERDKSQKEYVGAKLREGENKVKLPYWLGSMDKIKPSDPEKIERWVKKYPAASYFITEKLDGVSCLLMWDGEELKLYTRGDGKVGADISYLAKYINYIPKKIKEPINVRGELIISKKAWDKYKDKFANPRNLVSGLINSKTAREGLKDIDFIAYEIVGDEKMEKISQQFQKLNKTGFKVAKHTEVEEIDVEILIDILNEFRMDSPYNIDGIIIQMNESYARNTSGNPGYAFAFKMLTEGNMFPTRVIRVEWNLSKRGLLKPRVNVEPVNIDGVIIKFATGKNAKFIKENGIGPGAVVNIARGGDVIPDIISVVKATEPGFPDEEFKWNETGVDIIPVNIDKKAFCQKILLDFFNIFGIAFVSEGTIRKFMDNNLDTVFKILRAEKDDFAKIEGLGEKSAEKIYNNIHNGLKNITLAQLMASSSLFGSGVGVKKLETLLEDVPNLLTLDIKKMRDKILEVKGFSEITADKIVNNIPTFLVFMQEILPFVTFKTEKKKKKGDVTLKVVFSGFRDKELQEEIEAKGGEVTSAVSGKTTHLVVKDKSEVSTKISKAKDLGIPVLEEDEFRKILEKF